MPLSIALSMTLRVDSSSIRPPKLLQPRPTRETRRPERPRLRVSMGRSPSMGRTIYQQSRRAAATASHARPFRRRWRACSGRCRKPADAIKNLVRDLLRRASVGIDDQEIPGILAAHPFGLPQRALDLRGTPDAD